MHIGISVLQSRLLSESLFFARFLSVSLLPYCGTAVNHCPLAISTNVLLVSSLINHVPLEICCIVTVLHRLIFQRNESNYMYWKLYQDSSGHVLGHIRVLTLTQHYFWIRYMFL